MTTLVNLSAITAPREANAPLSLSKLGPWRGAYHPGYKLTFYRDGDPTKRISRSEFDHDSASSITTSKNLSNTIGMGQFTLAFKDARAWNALRPMDVVVISLKGHNHGWGTVLKGLIDSVEPGQHSSLGGDEEEVVVTGRCMAKYLAVNSLFLPVWDPRAPLPTALIFGMGGVTNQIAASINPKAKIDTSTPKGIFGYLYTHFVVGLRNRVGLSGTPNARFWLHKDHRFEFVEDADGGPFKIPFIQFDEDTVDVALSQLEILGFTEAWVDELGSVVFRAPQWSAPASYVIYDEWETGELPTTDIGLSTYVEVIPSGNPGLSSAEAQALMAGRAPIPSNYVQSWMKAAGPNSPIRFYADPDYVIDTDQSGKPTADGLANPWYQKQKKYGLRPYQVTSPLLVTQSQAQQQAQGLLLYFNRLQKTANLVLPGEPSIKVGTTIQLVGRHGDQALNRTYYIEGVQHEYVEGTHYKTLLTLTHGRDPGDPKWTGMVLNPVTPREIAKINGGGVSDNSPKANSPKRKATDPVGTGASAKDYTTVDIDKAGYKWLGPLPTTGPRPVFQFDERILPNVEWVLDHFGLTPTAGYAPVDSGGHAASGEHPLGLALDCVPTDGDWKRTLACATFFGWLPANGASGVTGILNPLRFIGYNGYPGHGDPQHAGSNAHLHLSWLHAPAAPMTQAQWVAVMEFNRASVPSGTGHKPFTPGKGTIF